MRGELTLDVWLENQKVVQSTGAGAGHPSVLLRGGSAARTSWAVASSGQNQGPGWADIELGQQ